MKTFLLIVMVLIIAATSTVAWNVSRSTRAAAVVLGNVAQKAAVAEADVRRAEARLAAAEQDAVTFRAKLEGMTAAKSRPAAGETTPVAMPQSAPLPSAQVLEKKLAEAREKTKTAGQLYTLADERRRCTYVYQSLFRELGLSAAQIKAFVDIALQRYERGLDFNALLQDGFVTRDDPVVEKYRRAFAAQDDAAFRELLGAAGYQRFKEYNRTTTAREIIEGFGATAATIGIPVKASHLEQLVQVLADSHTRTNQRVSGYPDGLYVSWQFDPIDWEVADVRLRALMTDAEWNLFRTQGNMSGRFAHGFKTALWKANQAEAAAAKSR